MLKRLRKTKSGGERKTETNVTLINVSGEIKTETSGTHIAVSIESVKPSKTFVKQGEQMKTLFKIFFMFLWGIIKKLFVLTLLIIMATFLLWLLIEGNSIFL
jgi:hypothetical protein